MSAAPAAAPAAGPYVAVLAPTGRDARVAGAVLGRAGFRVRAFDDMRAGCAAVAGAGDADGEPGVLLVPEEALRPLPRAELLAELAAQPAWSDLPVVLLTGEEALSRGVPAAAASAAHAANVTLLERPVRVATLATTLGDTLLARRRQLVVRDHP
ncbi:hypothetical protein PYV61_06990, partial [Roseisolibacter sp. H3M3-2]